MTLQDLVLQTPQINIWEGSADQTQFMDGCHALARAGES